MADIKSITLTNKQAAELIRKYDAYGCGYCHQGGEEYPEAFEMAAKALEAEPQHGQWIDEQDGRWIYAKCSLCGTVHNTKTNYCPHCGADMREVEE